MYSKDIINNNKHVEKVIISSIRNYYGNILNEL